MASRTPSLIQLAAVASIALLQSEISSAIPFDAGLFVQNNLRECSGPTSCVGGDPSIERDSDSDLAAAGTVTTQILGPTLGTQAAASAGYTGNSFAPAISAYAFTEGPMRFTVAALGLQRYEFLADGQVTIDGTLTFAQSGQTAPTSENPRGTMDALFMAFQMAGDVFDPENCNIYNLFSGLGVFNEAGSITSCLRLNGSQFGNTVVDFAGLQNYQEAAFDIGNDPVDAGQLSQSLTVSGNAGDVFYLAASIGGRAHLGGFFDSRSTLTLGIDQFDIVGAAFQQQTFVPAPLPLPEPGTLLLMAFGLFGLQKFNRRKSL